MRIAFIHPRMIDQRDRDCMEPLVYAVLAALSKDAACVFYDERMEDLPEIDCDLVAMSVMTFCARRAYELADGFRKRGIKVVLGGFHPSLCPDEAAEHADAIVIGDAEEVWPQLLADFKDDDLKSRYRADFSTSLSMPVDRRIFGSRRYLKARIVQFGRGCPFTCEFCAIQAFYGGERPVRLVEEVLAELRSFPPGTHVVFADDNFPAQEEVRELLEAMCSLQLTWSCQAGVEICRDQVLLALMKRSGCQTVTIGFETMVEENLRQMGKTRRGCEYDEAVQSLYCHGIMVYGTFIFGYDHDTADSFRLSLEFAERNRLFLANFNPLIPMPGTALYKRLQGEGRLLWPTWWIDPAYRYGETVFQPARMSAEGLTRGCFETRMAFNRFHRIAWRSVANPVHRRSLKRLSLCLAANLVNRVQISRKQGRALG